jgi:hypothetical protein
MTREEQINLLKSLSFIKYTQSQWLVTGGFAMQTWGLRDNNADIDILVIPEVFNVLALSPLYTKGKNSQGVPSNDTLLLSLANIKLVEIMKREPGPEYTKSQTIVRNSVIIPIINPDHLLAWKLQHNRAKDKEDIKLLLKFVAKTRGVEFVPDPVNLESKVDIEGPFRKFKQDNEEILSSK